MSTSFSMLDAATCFSNRRGCDIIFRTNSFRTNSLAIRSSSHYLNVSPACGHLEHVGSLSMHSRINYNFPCRKGNCFNGTTLSMNVKKIARLRIHASLDVASAVDVINDLGLDTLTFLAVTVLVVPGFKMIKASPILGFFFAGVVLNQLGLIRNITDVKVLSEWGILFLLFEMGLELSLARLRALAKFAFGLGLTQVLLSTLAFSAFELPPNGAIGTRILEFLFHSRPDLVNIRSIDEAVVIGAALSLSSSAFVLQLLAEKGELPTRFGSATLGILLLQDIAVVPLLVILPVLESQNLVEESIWPMLAKESLKALGGLGLLSLGGKYLLRRIFEVVADTRSSEAFVALCLLTVAGTSLITQKLGFSDTLGAFLAGALLAETNFRTQIEADIRPFRGLLLGLFFVTTGTSIDMQLLIREWPNVFSLLAGLIVIKTMIITAIGPRVGLSLQESIRIGLLLSQGGEFAFVVFSLANRLGVLPLELNKLLIIVVVLSMALTPLLNEVGRKVADYIGERFEDEVAADDSVNFDASEPVVIVGFGQKAQVLANFLSTPLAAGSDSMDAGWPYVAFDLDLSVVKTSRKLGFPVLYGDGSRPAVLQSAGINSPKAVMVMYTGKSRTIEAVQRIRLGFPGIPIYARAQDMMHLLDLKKAGATDAILENAETSLQLGSKLLKGLGVMSDEVSFLSQLVRDSMESQAQEALGRAEDQELNVMKPLQVKASDLVGIYAPSKDDEYQKEITQTSKYSTLKSTTGNDLSHDNGKLSLDDEEAKGVLYCEIGTPTESNNIQSRDNIDEADVRNPIGSWVMEAYAGLPDPSGEMGQAAQAKALAAAANTSRSLQWMDNGPALTCPTEASWAGLD
ncbi:glutathione-regulated potassium-efflux system protein [Striga asiatica]|uniref:Glutathione-regulated potassium-efflux system protein n=1 Tax=Striga asiatica TaxID=4170 RepID=A0A5A7QA31_STRAF|nr:glutathione-regulated potassium-efflux system protein [Striga asiatica]